MQYKTRISISTLIIMLRDVQYEPQIWMYPLQYLKDMKCKPYRWTYPLCHMQNKIRMKNFTVIAVGYLMTSNWNYQIPVSVKYVWKALPNESETFPSFCQLTAHYFTLPKYRSLLELYPYLLTYLVAYLPT